MRDWDWHRLLSLASLAETSLTHFQELHGANAAGNAPWQEMLMKIDDVFSAANTIRALIRREKRTRA